MINFVCSVCRQVKSFLSSFVADDIAPDKCPLEVLDRLTAEVKKDHSLKLEEKWILAAENK